MIKAKAIVSYPDGEKVEAELEAVTSNQTAAIHWKYPTDYRLPRADPEGPWTWLSFFLKEHALRTGGSYSEVLEGDWTNADDVFL